MKVYRIRATGKEISLTEEELNRLYFNWNIDKLENFLACPLSFYFYRVVSLHKNEKVDIRPKPQFVFDLIIQEILYRFFEERMKNGFKEPKSLENLFLGMWNSLTQGKNFAGLKPTWKWKKVDFENKYQFWSMKELGIKLCRDFWHKNIHYFKDDSFQRPLVRVPFVREFSEKNENYRIYEKIDRIDFFRKINNEAYLINYQIGHDVCSYYLSKKDHCFSIYQWLYYSAYQLNMKQAPIPLKGMAIYPLTVVNDHNKLSFSELISVSLKNTKDISNFKQLIVEVKEKLEECLENGDFPAYSGSHCKNCPFKKQCLIYLDKRQSINDRLY